MKTGITDLDGARDHVRARIREGSWWTLIPDTDRMYCMVEIETTFYKDKRNADFELMFGVLPGVGLQSIALAKKQWCSPSELAAMFNRWGIHEVNERCLRQQDILVMASQKYPLVDLYEWLKDRPGEERTPSLDPLRPSNN